MAEGKVGKVGKVGTAAVKRAYKAVAVVETPGGLGVALDGRPLRHAGGAPMAMRSRALAEAVAEEWRGQGDRIRPDTMPLTQLATLAAGSTPGERAALIEAALRYAETDALCYRAREPQDLADRQRADWDPLLAWAEEALGAPFATTVGVMPCRQLPATLAALRRAVAALDAGEMVALSAVLPALGSLVIGLALVNGRLAPEAAFAAALLDELYQNERWGGDAEALDRQQRIRAEIEAAHRFLALHRA